MASPNTISTERFTETHIYVNGQATYLFGPEGLRSINTNTGFGWATDPTAALDTQLTRAAAANIRQGAADAAAPVAQTFSVQSVLAGNTNTAGANRTFSGSRGTGTGVGGDIIFTVASPGSSGSTQNALATSFTLKGDAAKSAVFVGPVVFPSYTVATLPAAATYQYARAFVTDANATTFNSTVAGGGANKVPVWSDGTNWKIG